MKKIYFLFSAMLVAGAVNAQITITDPGFENYVANEADDWIDFGGSNDTLLVAPYNETATIGGIGGAQCMQGSTITPPQGTYSLALSTVTYSTSGVKPGEAYQLIISSEVADELTYSYRANIQAGDTSIVEVVALNSSFNVVRVANKLYTSADNGATFTAETVTFQGGSSGIAYYLIFIASSMEGTWTTNTPLDGTIFEIDDMAISTHTLADPVTNIVGTDISDNQDGSDLEVTFNKAADEATVATYRVLAIEAGLALVNYEATGIPYVDVTPDGSTSYTVNFTGSDQYIYNAGGGSAAAGPIVEDVAMDIIVVSMPAGSATLLSTATSAQDVTLTSSGASIAEKLKDVMFAYPNPATNELNFNIGNNAADQINILDISGRVVTTTTINASVETINVANYENGVYFYQIISNGDVVKTDKFVVSK